MLISNFLSLPLYFHPWELTPHRKKERTRICKKTTSLVAKYSQSFYFETIPLSSESHDVQRYHQIMGYQMCSLGHLALFSFKVALLNYYVHYTAITSVIVIRYKSLWSILLHRFRNPTFSSPSFHTYFIIRFFSGATKIDLYNFFSFQILQKESYCMSNTEEFLPTYILSFIRVIMHHSVSYTNFIFTGNKNVLPHSIYMG